MPSKEKSNSDAMPLVVTTAHRGVFFGYGTRTEAKTIRLTQARMCISWSSTTKGMPGLASTGPDKNCRVTLPTPAVTLSDVTAVFEASPEAAAAWEKRPWS